MKEEIEQMEIIFKPEWFQSAYYVYVLTIEHNDKQTYYYVGQTGDRNHKSARSPFYRLMGHYNTYNFTKGTDAQLVKGLFNNNLIKQPEDKSKRVCVEEAIKSGAIKITAKYFKIADFGELEHKSCVKMVEEIELKLIQLMKKKYELFNKQSDEIKEITNKENIERAETIFNLLRVV